MKSRRKILKIIPALALLPFVGRAKPDYIAEPEIANGKWTHVCFVVPENGPIRCYVDGKFVGHTKTATFKTPGASSTWTKGADDE